MLIKRFHMEALAVSKLEHPNTIRIFDFGQTEQGVLFIAMEFLSGRALEHELRARGAMAARRVAHIMAQVCRSLGEAHKKGIVHRDLKPDNIFLCHIDGDPDYAKVLDFGVAKLAAHDRKQGTMTQAGMVFGTPKYMSPEQSRSDITDARSDIYALGIILYEMLAGKPPFDAENPLSILIQHVQEPVKPFSVVRPDILIPPPIERVVEKCLRKKPEERFQSAEELAEALQNAWRALDKSFDKVITRDEAEKLGLELNTDEAFTRPAQEKLLLPAQLDETEPMSPEEAQALIRRLARRRRRKVAALSAAAGLVLLAVGTLVAWFSLPGAPDGFQRLFAQPLESIAPVPQVTADTVRLTLGSRPIGATVYVGDEYVGRAPLEITRWRGDSQDTYTFRLDGYEPVELPVPRASDGEFLAELRKVEPQVVERVVEKVITKEVVREPVAADRPTGPGRDRTTKPAEPTGPVMFQGGKVGDLKKLKP
jgi:serine/threonine-protein kinase